MDERDGAFVALAPGAALEGVGWGGAATVSAGAVTGAGVGAAASARSVSWPEYSLHGPPQSSGVTRGTAGAGAFGTVSTVRVASDSS
ncbi:MAG: hypothetical protein OEW53_04575, partial [Actinomycetota bacterium]|nr:hypothetical protein [Actinomycetota bacterium]